ncbi:MAG TPA: fibrobacter succinogenes major paralogous domain-containing protein [Candidatus Alistipes excrementigallinarum]|nr:fibrobacter succinogenes major paralogous domain-containing protein [Candidatus Alistipes excrementigallinarum]
MKQLLLLMCSVALMFATGCKNDETNPTPPPATTGSDLSAAGCANSYLVHGAGAYSFDATVMGNGVSTEPFAATKLSPSSAALLWQDAPALLSDVRLEEGRVHFTAGEGQGNALIAVRDADGRILWSWHIWVTDYDPSSQAPKLNGLSWMTRNLGALSDDYDETGSAKGFVYQWGRKDPFPSGAGWNDLNDITVYDASGTAATDLFANEANFIYDEAAFGRRHALLGYYPAAGNRGAASGTWSFVGGQASYWTSTATQEQYSYILNFLAAYLNPQSSSNRAAGCSVRCVSETQGEPDPEPSTGDTFTLTTVTDATYQGGTGSDGSANYYIGLSNVPFEIDDQGEQVPTEPGIILYLDLYGQASQDASAARLPEGTYTLKSGATTGTANPDYTWAREKKQDGTIAYRKPVEGEITVLHTQKRYLIEGTFVVGTEEENFAFTYEGELAFVDRTDPSGGAPVIREPVNVTFTSASATWEYTGDESDRYTIRLQEGTVEGGYLAHGHQLTIDLLSKPLSSKEEMVLAEDVYSPSNDYVSPMTFTQGSTFNLMGYVYYYGTYLQQVESLEETPLIGFAQEGTIEVKRSGSQYEFIVDVTTPEGVSIKGTYPMGDVNFIDNAPEKPAGDWLSILHEDKTVLFNPDDASECRVWTYTSYFEGATEFEILVDNNTTDEAFQLDVLAAEGATSIAGTYTTPKDPDNPQAGEFIPGYQEFAVKRGTWPYLYYDFSASQYIGAPATEGTIEITELEDGKVEIQYEMKDDADPKNTIRSVWSGTIRKVN